MRGLRVVAAGLALRALRFGLPAAVVVGALHTHFRERADVAVRAARIVQRGAIGYIERETFSCPTTESAVFSNSYAHDICHGEIVMGPGPVQPDARYPPLTFPSGETCDIKVDDTVRQGESEMTVVYRGTSREAVQDEAAFTVEARLPWLGWTIVARGGGDFVAATQSVRARDVVATLEGFPALTF
jgi:hypothetical protein